MPTTHPTPYHQPQIGFKIWTRPVTLMEQPHTHNDIEINLVLQGQIHYLMNGRSAFLNPGRLACFWGAVPHSLIDKAPGTTAVWVTLPLPWALRWELPDPALQKLLAGGVLSPPEPDPVTQSTALRWAHDFQNPALHNVILLEIQAQITRISLLTHDETTSNPRPAYLDRSDASVASVVKMSRFMSDHWDEPITIAHVAAHADLNPNYATTLFKKATGQGLLQYLTQLRLASAQRLLATTDLAVLEIALQVGFGSLSQFYDVFKRQVGQTPRDFRNAMRKTR
jgi:AraC family transcriptional regulator, melibiose operon regulatory protein